jgi:hypothetical protein
VRGRLALALPYGTARMLPNFLIIGAAKSGTTSLQAYLDQHADVFFSPSKEPNYFALADIPLPQPGPAPPDVLYHLLYRHSVTDYETYLALFEGVGSQRAVGEASVRYLYYPEAPGRIRALLPDARLVAVLREPVSRLYSHYCMNVQYQLEPLDLQAAIEAEPSRREAAWGWDWHYVAIGRYAEQLERYFALFDREQIKVVLYDDFVARPLDVFRDIGRHIGVDDGFVPDMSDRGKVAYRARNLTLDRWLHWPNPLRAGLERHLPRQLVSGAIGRLERWNSAPVPRLDRRLRSQLSGLFDADTRRLEDMLGRHLPWHAASEFAAS